jgi:hypothetical protein
MEDSDDQQWLASNSHYAVVVASSGIPLVLLSVEKLLWRIKIHRLVEKPSSKEQVGHGARSRSYGCAHLFSLNDSG